RMRAAFSAAIAASVGPRTSWWSRSRRVITVTAGTPTVVASSRPPSPTSSTATSTASRAKWSSASAVVASNIVASRRATSVPSASTPSTTPSSAYVTGGLARLGRLVREEGQDPAQRLLEVAPVHDQVELPVLEQELRALEALGERLADRLGDDARPGEADERARLGHDHVAE